MRPVNDILRFLLELAALAALAYAGFSADGVAASWLLGLGLPLLFVLLWGTSMSPKARHPVHDPARLLAEIVLLGGPAAALALTDHPALAVTLGALVALHLALTFALHQRQPAR